MRMQELAGSYHADNGSRRRASVRGVPRGFLLLLVISTLGTMSSGAVAPVLPRFVEGELGGGDTLVGIVVAITPLCALVGGLLAGPRVDQRGRRVVAVGGLSAALAGALLLVPADGVALTMVARTLFGLGAGASAAALITWAVDQVPAERRGRALSVFGMTVWVGLSAGPQLGEAVADARGYSGVWLTVVGLELAALLLALTGREVARPGLSPPARTSAAAPAGPRARRRLVPRGAVRPGILIAIASYGEGVIIAFLVLQLIDRGVEAGAGLGGAASVYTIFAASVLVCRLVAASLFDRLRPDTIAAGGFVLEAAGLAILAVASSFGVAAAGAALMGAGFAVLLPSLALVATDGSAEDERGAALGSFGAAFGLGLGLGSLVGGAIAALVGTGAAHLSAAGVAGLAALYLVRRRAERATRVPIVEQSP
jgi:MFS family permease